MFKYIILLIFWCEFSKCEILGKYLGADCTWRERAGKCVNIFRCRSALDDIKKKDPPSICSFQGSDPIICCTDCDLVIDTRKMVYDPNIGPLIKIGTKSQDQCYTYLNSLEYPCKKGFKYTHTTTLEKLRNCNKHTDRYSDVNKTIISDVVRRSPHMAYLGYGENMDNADWLCGGSVISERFILTAASCMKPDISTGSVKFVALGIHKRWVSPSEWQRYGVERAIPHPEYKAPSNYHDIALIQTDKTIIFGPNVLPACLDSGIQELQQANSVIWSEGENGTLDIATLSSFDEICSFFYSAQPTLINGYNRTTQLCFGDKQKPKDSCDGEIGSPLQTSVVYCFQKIVGVASIKRQCGEAGGSGLYTKVSYYVPWIESIVWP